MGELPRKAVCPRATMAILVAIGTDRNNIGGFVRTPQTLRDDVVAMKFPAAGSAVVAFHAAESTTTSSR